MPCSTHTKRSIQYDALLLCLSLYILVRLLTEDGSVCPDDVAAQGRAGRNGRISGQNRTLWKPFLRVFSCDPSLDPNSGGPRIALKSRRFSTLPARGPAGADRSASPTHDRDRWFSNVRHCFLASSFFGGTIAGHPRGALFGTKMIVVPPVRSSVVRGASVMRGSNVAWSSSDFVSLVDMGIFPFRTTPKHSFILFGIAKSPSDSACVTQAQGAWCRSLAFRVSRTNELIPFLLLL